MIKRTEQCGNCTAWRSEPSAGRGVGHCLASPPQVVLIKEVPRTFFPKILWTGWCRQHKPTKGSFEPPPDDKSGLPLPVPELTPEAIALKAAATGSMMPGGGPNPRRIAAQELTNKGQTVPPGVVQSAEETGERFRPKTLQQALAENPKP